MARNTWSVSVETPAWGLRRAEDVARMKAQAHELGAGRIELTWGSLSPEWADSLQHDLKRAGFQATSRVRRTRSTRRTNRCRSARTGRFKRC